MSTVACDVCEPLRNSSFKAEERSKHTIDFRRLRALSDQGCYSSRLLLEAINQVENAPPPPDELHKVDIRASLLHPAPPITYSLAFEVPRGLVIPARYSLEFTANSQMTDQNDHIPVLRDAKVQIARFPGRHIPEQPDSDMCFERIWEWIKKCITEHDCCNLSLDTKLPTRVISVDSRNSTEEPKLVETNGTMTGNYVALSHCWGKDQVQKTLKCNLKERKESIPISTLNRTFRDAIAFVRSGGFQYLWIDSLCIIQDDKDDWFREASKMATIYEQALLTISATSARDGRDGLFAARSVFGEQVKIIRDKSITNPVYIRDKMSHRAFELGHDDAHRNSLDVEAYPVFTRSWCHQERMLSTRVLHYTKYELVWECASSMMCECVWETELAAAQLMAHHILYGKLSYHQPFNMIDDEVTEEVRPYLNARNPRISRYNDWYSMLEHYTKLKLTYESDIFPALSGMAAKFEAEDSDRYLAGLWEADLGWGLAWKPTRPGTPRLKNNLAPTWSWASVSGPVRWPDADLFRLFIDQPMFKLVTTQVVSKDAKTLRDFASGRLRLCGLLVQLRVVEQVENGVVRVSPASAPESAGVLIALDISNTSETEAGAWSESLYCFGLVRNAFSLNTFSLGLALTRIHCPGSSGPEVYERVGTFQNHIASVELWEGAKESEIILV